MKNFAILLGAVLISVIILAFAVSFQRDEQLTKQEFANRDAYLNKRIDSLKTLILEIKASQDTIRTDLDTLKMGQEIIYNEVKKVASKSFLDMFNL